MMNRWSLRCVMGAVAVLALSGCATPDPVSPPPQMLRFTQQPPINLDVARVEIVNAYIPREDGSSVEDIFPLRPADAVRQWAADRLHAVGTTGVARVTIKDASIVSTDLPETKGLRGAFTVDQTERFSGSIAVEIVADAPERRMSGVADARTTRVISVAEDATVADREKAQYTMVRDMMEDLNTQLDQSVHTYLIPFLSY